MKKVIVYVEGSSDKLSMEALLRHLLQQKRQEGVVIDFIPALKGDRKEYILTTIPMRAVSILINDPHSIVVTMPDLYPKDKGFKHETFDELRVGILRKFNNALQRKGIGDDARLRDRFKVFCFKYDLEALILASEEALKSRLGVDHLDITWRIPVEDQDHDDPPKQIVEKLFREHGKHYKSTVARSILEASDYQDIANKCPQCFKPFVEFLTNL